MEYKLHSVYKIQKVHVNIYRVIGHKTIKTKQKTNALLILETQNFKTSTLATSATMPE